MAAAPPGLLSHSRRALLAAAVACGLVSGLAVPSPAGAAVADVFTAHLTAEAEVPKPGPEGATGTASLVSYLDRVEICYEITINVLPSGDVVTAGHIHVGEEGVAGDIVLPLFAEPPAGDPISGCVQDFDVDLQNQLLANPAGYYVDIHTEAYPRGAVRGQIELTSPGIPPGTCNVTVEPSTVAVGQQFVVAGDFGGYAEIHLVPGEDAQLPEDSEPAATVPQGVSPFSVTFTAKARDEGTWTVWAFRPEARGCADSAILTIAAAPNTAMGPKPRWPPAVVGMLLLMVAIALAAPFMPGSRRAVNRHQQRRRMG